MLNRNKKVGIFGCLKSLQGMPNLNWTYLAPHYETAIYVHTEKFIWGQLVSYAYQISQCNI